MIYSSLAAFVNSKGLTHDWLLGSFAVTDTKPGMLGKVQEEEVMPPILHLHEAVASFDPFPYIWSPPDLPAC